MWLNETSTGHSPSPSEAQMFRLDDGRFALIRPLEEEDDRLYADFDGRIDPEDRRLRFFSASRLGSGLVERLTHFDRQDALAAIATDPVDGSMLGVARLHRVGEDAGEFAVMVRSDAKGHHLGRALLLRALRGADGIGVRTAFGLILRENTGMLGLARDLGFSLREEPGEPGMVQAFLGADGLRALGGPDDDADPPTAQ